MSGRFFRGGRYALQVAMQTSRANRRPTANRTTSVITSNIFSLTFTPASMMQSAIGQQSVITTGGGGAIGSVRAQSTSTSSAANGSKGCGAPSCCGGLSMAVTGDDAEEPFIGAPSLSSSFSTQLSSGTGGVTVPLAKSNKPSQITGATDNTGAAASSPNSPSSPPPPRTKCDPYEQGGHPLTTEVVLHHMKMSLDSDWSYAADRKMLVRSFDFRKEFAEADNPGADVRALFDFVAQLGNIAQHAPGPAGHSYYNLNLNLRANSVQVMLKTRALAGISWQDFLLATKTDGVFFRAKLKRDEEKEAKQRQTRRT